MCSLLNAFVVPMWFRNRFGLIIYQVMTKMRRQLTDVCITHIMAKRCSEMERWDKMQMQADLA